MATLSNWHQTLFQPVFLTVGHSTWHMTIYPPFVTARHLTRYQTFSQPAAATARHSTWHQTGHFIIWQRHFFQPAFVTAGHSIWDQILLQPQLRLTGCFWTTASINAGHWQCVLIYIAFINKMSHWGLDTANRYCCLVDCIFVRNAEWYSWVNNLSLLVNGTRSWSTLDNSMTQA